MYSWAHWEHMRDRERKRVQRATTGIAPEIMRRLRFAYMKHHKACAKCVTHATHWARNACVCVRGKLRAVPLKYSCPPRGSIGHFQSVGRRARFWMFNGGVKTSTVHAYGAITGLRATLIKVSIQKELVCVHNTAIDPQWFINQYTASSTTSQLHFLTSHTSTAHKKTCFSDFWKPYAAR